MNLSFLFCIEAMLVLLNIVLWLGPFLRSIRKGFLNALHPQFITPVWIVYFILNTMIQNWYPWMGGTEHGILRTTSKVISENPYYLVMPLLIVAGCAFFYHFGVRLFCRSIVDSESERIRIIKVTKVIPKGQKISFLVLAFIVSGIAWLPNYFIPNAGFGTFWTYPLALTNAVLPFMIFCVNKPIGLLSFVFVVASALVMKSKASFLYPVLIIIFYYSFRFRVAVFRLKSWIILCTFIFLSIFALSFGFNDARRLLHRDYAFESFAALVDKAPNFYFGNAKSLLLGKNTGPCISWTLKEIEKGIPSILYPSKRYNMNPSKMVSFYFLPDDYKALPNAYFNRFFVFAGYYDFGIIGAFIAAIGFGALYGWFWRKTKYKIFKSGYLWPLFLYLPIPAIATYFVACGGLTYGFINAFVPAGVIFIIVIVSRFLMQVAINCRRDQAS